MPLSQQEIDSYLNKKYTVPMEIYEDAPIPQSNGFYSELLRATNNGFSFTARELLHTIGCKTAALPMSDTDSCLKSAYLYFHVLDFNAEQISFKPGRESDLQTNRSNEIGIGMACLIANRFFNINWDQFESIPVGRGERFDYRAPIGNGGKAIFEAKGTKYFHNQIPQISHGIRKKEAYHSRGEHFEVELIISTHIGIRGDEPRILIADPKFEKNDLAFSAESNKLYKYRHYARVLQYIGATNISREYYLTSQEIVGQISQKRLGKTSYEIFDEISYEERKQIEPKNQKNNIFVNDTEFIGQWFDYWIPPESKRYKKLLENKKLEFKEKYNIKIFQGIDKRIYDMLLSDNLEEINLLTWNECRKYTKMKDGGGVSVFPDSTILAVKITE